MTIAATFTSNGQTAEQDNLDSLGRFSSGHESKLAVQVSRTSGSANYAVEIQAGFRDSGPTQWGTLLEVTQADDATPKFVEFNFGLLYRLRCKTRGAGNTLRAILG